MEKRKDVVELYEQNGALTGRTIYVIIHDGMRFTFSNRANAERTAEEWAIRYGATIVLR
jgi:hypothetical protein